MITIPPEQRAAEAEIESLVFRLTGKTLSVGTPFPEAMQLIMEALRRGAFYQELKQYGYVEDESLLNTSGLMK